MTPPVRRIRTRLLCAYTCSSHVDSIVTPAMPFNTVRAEVDDHEIVLDWQIVLTV
jgi:hypothetical protein